MGPETSCDPALRDHARGLHLFFFLFFKTIETNFYSNSIRTKQGHHGPKEIGGFSWCPWWKQATLKDIKILDMIDNAHVRHYNDREAC